MKVFEVAKNDRLLIGTGSSGCQPKWLKDGFYIKIPVLGYEHATEVITTKFLEQCDLRGFEYLTYHMCEVYEDGVYKGQGCYSRSFLEEGDVEVSALNIITIAGRELSIGYNDAIELFQEHTGLFCKEYINMILAIDAIVKNEDRHFRNIAFIRGADGTYRYAPFYDFGAGLLSDVFTHPMGEDIDHALQSVYAKPFSVFFGKDIEDFTPISINVDGVISLCNSLKNNEYTHRAVRVLMTALRDTEGTLWERL